MAALVAVVYEYMDGEPKWLHWVKYFMWNTPFASCRLALYTLPSSRNVGFLVAIRIIAKHIVITQLTLKYFARIFSRAGKGYVSRVMHLSENRGRIFP